MQNRKCGQCGRIVPLADSFRYRNAEYCMDCVKAMADDPGIDGNEVSRNVDATLCANCGKDGGEAEYAPVSGLRLCPDCERALLHRPFPAGIKAFFAATAAIVLLGFFFNRGYFVAYGHMRAGMDAVKAADVPKAASRFQAASAALPGQSDLKYQSNFFGGIALLIEEKYEPALALLKECKGVYSDEAYLDELIAAAEVGDSFEKKDYRRMLKASQDHLAASPRDGRRVLALASACACVYASEGDAAYRAKAETLMEEADALKTDENRAEYDGYERRIRHRIATKSIIDEEEYYALFPAEAAEAKR